MNGDGLDDPIVSVDSGAAPSVQVFLSWGDGTVGTPSTFSLTEQPVSIATGDFNLDKSADVAVTTRSGNVAVSVDSPYPRVAGRVIEGLVGHPTLSRTRWAAVFADTAPASAAAS